MATGAARATKRAVLEHANKAAEGVNLALLVSTQVAREWRLFCGLSLPRRLWWLLTGQIRPSTAALRADRETPAPDAPAHD